MQGVNWKSQRGYSRNFGKGNAMSKRYLSILLGVLLSVGCALEACAQAKPETLVKQRQAVMELHGKYMYGVLNAMARNRIPYDAVAAARAIGFLDALSKMPWDGFSPATKDVKATDALPAVYAEPAKFKAAQEQYLAEIAKLVALTKGGGEAAIKEQITATNNSCNNCHDSFRAKS